MAYNNPVASGGTDLLPGFLLRLAREVDAVVAVKECSGDARRIAALAERPTSRCSWAATTGRSRASPPAPPAGSPAWRTWRPRSASRCSATSHDGELEAARELNARILPLARLDMTPKLVQYFKAAQDAVGRVGGPCRPPRMELTAEERAILDAALGALRGQEVAA